MKNGLRELFEGLNTGEVTLIDLRDAPVKLTPLGAIHKIAEDDHGMISEIASLALATGQIDQFQEMFNDQLRDAKESVEKTFSKDIIEALRIDSEKILTGIDIFDEIFSNGIDINDFFVGLFGGRSNDKGNSEKPKTEIPKGDYNISLSPPHKGKSNFMDWLESSDPAPRNAFTVPVVEKVMYVDETTLTKHGLIKMSLSEQQRFHIEDFTINRDRVKRCSILIFRPSKEAMVMYPGSPKQSVVIKSRF